VIAGFTDDRGDRLEAGTARRAPATLTHDELEGLAVIGDRDRADHDGLENADLAQRVRELIELVLVEHRARVARVLAHLMNRDLRELRAGDAQQAAIPEGLRGRSSGLRIL